MSRPDLSSSASCSITNVYYKTIDRNPLFLLVHTWSLWVLIILTMYSTSNSYALTFLGVAACDRRRNMFSSFLASCWMTSQASSLSSFLFKVTFLERERQRELVCSAEELSLTFSSLPQGMLSVFCSELVQSSRHDD